MTETDMNKLYEVDHDEDFSMTPEQFQTNLNRKIARLDIMAKLYNIETQKDEVDFV